MSFNQKLQQTAARRANEGETVGSVFDAANVRAALGVDTRSTAVDTNIVDDWICATANLAQSLMDDELFSTYEDRHGDLVTREYSDAHAFLGRLIWAIGKQSQRYSEMFDKNKGFLMNARDRANSGTEIDLDALARTLRIREQINAQMAFWDSLGESVKQAYANVTGDVYSEWKPRATPIASDAAKALVGALDELIK